VNSIGTPSKANSGHRFAPVSPTLAVMSLSIMAGVVVPQKPVFVPQVELVITGGGVYIVMLKITAPLGPCSSAVPAYEIELSALLQSIKTYDIPRATALVYVWVYERLLAACQAPRKGNVS